MTIGVTRQDALNRLFSHVVNIAGGIVVDRAYAQQARAPMEEPESPESVEGCGGCKGEASRLAKAKAARQARLAKHRR